MIYSIVFKQYTEFTEILLGSTEALPGAPRGGWKHGVPKTSRPILVDSRGDLCLIFNVIEIISQSLDRKAEPEALRKGRRP
jgi:hypothetical protein